MGVTVDRTEPAVRRSLDVLRRLFGAAFAHDFAVRFWDGTEIPARAGTARFTLVIRTPHALRAAFMPPLDLSPGRAFVEREIDLEGDLDAALAAFERALDGAPPLVLARLGAALLRLPAAPRDDDPVAAHLRGRRHSKGRDAAAIGFHYDQPVAFYRALLGETMVYSCAYWDDGIETLDGAQEAKIDHTLRKLRLRPGETLLDVGCGWGTLVVRAAQRFKARVLGITLSRRQHEEAQRRIAAAGVGDLARAELRDYRDLPGLTFDKIVSVGMVEHVGRERLDTYFATLFAALRPGGLFLNHGIAQRGRAWRSSGFLQRYVFPDGDLLPLSTMLRPAERAGFEVRDVENLREHYARTLRAWGRNLAAQRDAAIAATDERTERIWRLYVAGSARGFAAGRMDLFQTLLARPHRDGSIDLPATRRDLYAAPAVSA